MRYNKSLIKSLFKSGRHELEAYYYYCICRQEFSAKSGRFSLDELIETLYTRFNYTSLHNRPGNQKKVYKAHLKRILGASRLFKRLKYGDYQIIAERKLVTRFTTKREIKEGDLKTYRGFIDILIAVILDGNNFKSYERTAKQTGYTVRRIQLAVKRLVDAGELEKFNNIILDECFKHEYQAEGARQKLFAYQGISTPQPIPFRYKGSTVFYIGLYAANSYLFRVNSQADKADDYLKLQNRKTRRFNSISDQERKHYSTNARLYRFSDKYTVQDYLNEHGRLVLCA